MYEVPRPLLEPRKRGTALFSKSDRPYGALTLHEVVVLTDLNLTADSAAQKKCLWLCPISVQLVPCGFLSKQIERLADLNVALLLQNLTRWLSDTVN